MVHSIQHGNVDVHIVVDAHPLLSGRMLSKVNVAT